MNNMCKLVGSKEGKVVDRRIGSKKKIKWARIGGTLVVCSGILAFLTSKVNESLELQKFEISPDYLSYVDQIEDSFDTDLPPYMEDYINKYGKILEKINNYDDMTLNEQYEIRKQLVADCSFVENSSLEFLKDVGYSKFGGDRANFLVSFYNGPISDKVLLIDGQNQNVLHGDMEDVANAISDLQWWKNEDTENYVTDWKNEYDFSKFVGDIKHVIISTAYMMKNYVDDYQNDEIDYSSTINEDIKVDSIKSK